MTPRRFASAPWLAVALIAGLAIGWFGRNASEVQGSVLLLMIAAFAISLAGRGSAILIGVLVGLGVPIVSLFFPGDQPFNATSIIALLPAILGSGAGRLTGRLLGRATDALESDTGRGEFRQNPHRTLTRLLVSLALTLLAMIGIIPLTNLLRDEGQRAPLFLALVWQITSYVGWILLTPLTVRFGAWVRTLRNGPLFLSGPGLPIHAGFVLIAGLVHALGLLLLTRMLLIPVGPEGSAELFYVAAMTYITLDALTYVAILGLSHLSDTARNAREAVAREKALRAEVTEARLEALRAQLNPHFLYNALNALGTLSQAGRTEETAQILEGISGMLRYVLDEKRPLVPLRDELRFVQQYVDIQQLRFEGRLVATIDCPDELNNVMVPPLVLQPMVENAVEHGIARIGRGGQVSVKARADSGELVLTVEDDGAGMQEGNSSSDGIGMGNTRERLARLFGAEATVTLEPRGGGGAIGMVRLPLTRSPLGTA